MDMDPEYLLRPWRFLAWLGVDNYAQLKECVAVLIGLYKKNGAV